MPSLNVLRQAKPSAYEVGYSILAIALGIVAVLVTNWLHINYYVDFDEIQYIPIDVSLYVLLTQISIIVSLVVFIVQKWATTPYFNLSPFVQKFLLSLSYLVVLSVPAVISLSVMISVLTDCYELGEFELMLLYTGTFLFTFYLLYKLCTFAFRINAFLCEFALVVFSCGLPFAFLGGFLILGIGLSVIVVGITLLFIPFFMRVLYISR